MEKSAQKGFDRADIVREAARNFRASRNGGHRIFTLVRATAGGVRVRSMDGRSRGDQGQASEEAEDRPRGCSTAARLMLENNFPQVWVPGPENRDLRQLLWHRHRLVQMRTRIM